jgi:3-oxoacyl-[acyl-carrier-protein] synthase-1
MEGRGGIQTCTDRRLSDTDLPLSLVDGDALEARFRTRFPEGVFTRFEMLALLSARDALSASPIEAGDPHTLLILSTTKGNVELLDEPGGFDRDRLHLWKSAQIIADALGVVTRPLVVSNACISGLAAMLLAQRLIGNGTFAHAIVVGADVISKFIVSGFQSFLSLSSRACRPFDRDRDGLSLGEAAATVVLSRDYGDVELAGGALSNDANHISGPSRSGEGLYLAISGTLHGEEQPGMISAHGTATPYNDEMESIALARAGLDGIPVNSLKGYFGHTLGAAGVLESILNAEAMKEGFLPGTLGFRNPGVSGDILINRETRKEKVSSMLKIASGFGGCNAAALFRIRK